MNFCGLHLGRAGLYAVSLAPDGEILAEYRQAFSDVGEIPDLTDEMVARIEAKLSGPCLWSLGLEKPHRPYLAPQRAELKNINFSPQVVQPALAASLLGAVPSGPSVLVNLGRDLRLAAVDSSLQYREYRFSEGGGQWWQQELTRLSEHSQRLRLRLRDYEDYRVPLSRLNMVLETGSYPSPDPVLKPRLKKLAARVASMVVKLSSRLPGLGCYSMTGFLGRSVFGQQIRQMLVKEYPHLKYREPRFPPEVGAALMALALERENWERSHLGKKVFEPSNDLQDWSPSQVLLRRLFRLRKPFESFPR